MTAAAHTDSSTELEISKSGPVVQVRLNRPERLNALTEPMLERLDEAVDAINHDTDVKVVVLTGAGNAFCAGRDTSELAAVAGEPSDLPNRKGHATHRIADIDVPVIAALRGAVVGGGMGMVLMADLAVASQTTFFLDGHLAAGMCPSGSSWWLPRLTGYRRAMDIFLTGRRVGVREAFEIGLVSTVVDDDALEREVNTVCDVLSGTNRAALMRTKRAVRHGLENGFAASTEYISYLRALPHP